MYYDRLLSRLFIFNDLRLGAHVDASAAGFVGLNDASLAVNDSRGGKIRALYMLHQTIYVDIWIVQQRDGSSDNLIQVMRRNIRCHAHRDTRRSVYQ